MDARESSLRVLMLPWLAYGHISPFLELAKKLTERNIYIYLCSTPINLSFIKNKVTEKYSKSIELVELHLPNLPELPPQYHTTNGLPHHLMATLAKAFKMSSPNVSKILETIKPGLVLYDINQPFTPEIASSLSIPAVEFIIFGAVGVAFMIHMFQRFGEKFPFPAIHIKKFDRLRPRNCDFSGNDGNDEDLALGTLQRFGNLALVNTSREIEGKYLDLLSNLLGKKMIPIGPIIQDPIIDKDADNEILKWLDKKDESSTVFVSFGSECFLTKEEMIEVAFGLELSNVNFIWVVRFPTGEEISLEEVLPEGFLERVGERGIIVKGWAPQAKILGHPSTGGFASHCGWSSLMESMQFGVPIIAMPMHLDQPFNARLLVELGMGIEVEKNDAEMYKREDIEKTIRKVVSETDGDHVRPKASVWRERIRSIDEREMDEAVEELFRVCEEQKKKKEPVQALIS